MYIQDEIELDWTIFGWVKWIGSDLTELH